MNILQSPVITDNHGQKWRYVTRGTEGHLQKAITVPSHPVKGQDVVEQFNSAYETIPTEVSEALGRFTPEDFSPLNLDEEQEKVARCVFKKYGLTNLKSEMIFYTDDFDAMLAERHNHIGSMTVKFNPADWIYEPL